MDRKFRVAVVGATGLVGETMISVLEERDFPVAQLYALASERSLGRSVSFRGRSYPVRELKTFDFAQCDFALFSAGAAVSREHVPRALAAGCLVIDNTSEFRYREDVPLVVPEVNPQALAGIGTSGIIANPNCSTIQLVVGSSRSTTPPASSASTSRPTSPSPGPAGRRSRNSRVSRSRR